MYVLGEINHTAHATNGVFLHKRRRVSGLVWSVGWSAWSGGGSRSVVLTAVFCGKGGA